MSTSVAEVPSYSKIHYLLRPAKNIQRKMICEAAHRLDRRFPIRDYRYIGFGSVYFGDFKLFHRTLGISDMISIEGNDDHEERVRFNTPYACVDIKMGTSNERLPEIALDEKRWVLWLDYDFSIDVTVLTDLRHAAANAHPGCMLLMTVDVDDKGLSTLPPWAPEEDAEGFQNRTPREKLAYKVQREVSEDTDVRGEAFAETCRQLALADISGGLSANYAHRDLEFRQIMNFRYADGRRMMTLGGIFLPPNGEEALFEAFGFSELKFFSDSPEPYPINAPQLTFLEIRRLNQDLPTVAATQVPISEEDFADYKEIYRYFPSFSEMEL